MHCTGYHNHPHPLHLLHLLLLLLLLLRQTAPLAALLYQLLRLSCHAKRVAQLSLQRLQLRH
jgi:hypothetical protein